jgi:hypothetical protein
LRFPSTTDDLYNLEVRGVADCEPRAHRQHADVVAVTRMTVRAGSR